MNLLHRLHRFLIEFVVSFCTVVTVFVMLAVAAPVLMLGVLLLMSSMMTTLLFVADHMIGYPFVFDGWIVVKTIIVIIGLLTVMFYREMQPSRSVP